MKNLLLSIFTLSFAFSSYAQKWESTGFHSTVPVYSLLSTANGLYAGGKNGTQYWNGSNWTDMGEPSTHAFALVLAEYNDTVYMGADTYLNQPGPGTPTYRYMICKYTNKWEWAGGEFQKEAPISNPYLISFNGKLIVGGGFTKYDGTPINAIAAWDGTSWTSMGSGVERADRLIEHKGQLYASGLIVSIKRASDPTKDSIVHTIGKWNGTMWVPLDSNLRLRYMPGPMVSFQNDLIVAMYPTVDTLSGFPIDKIGRWVGNRFFSMGNGQIREAHGFHVFNNDLYLFGSIDRPGMPGNVQHVVMKWVSPGWQQVGGIFNFPVTSMAEYNGELYAGGHFTMIGNDTVKHLARLNTAPLPNGLAGQNAPRFRVYPNPATDDLTLETEERGTVYLYNQLGQLMSTYSIENTSTRIKTNELAAGVYTLRFETDKGRSEQRLVVGR